MATRRPYGSGDERDDGVISPLAADSDANQRAITLSDPTTIPMRGDHYDMVFRGNTIGYSGEDGDGRVGIRRDANMLRLDADDNDPQPQGVPMRRPNILLHYTDQQRRDALGATNVSIAHRVRKTVDDECIL